MNKKVIAVALACLAILTAVGIYSGNAIGEDADGVTKIAYASFDASATVGSSENPLKILEIVPDEHLATAQYLIPGAEEQLSGDALSYFMSVYANGDDGIAIRSTTEQSYFASDVRSIVNGSNATDVSNTDSTTNHFAQYGYFVHAESNGIYKYVAATDTTQGYFAPIEKGDVINDTRATYNWVPLVNYQQTTDNVAPVVSGVAAEAYYLDGDTYTNVAATSDGEYYTLVNGTSDRPFYATTVAEDTTADVTLTENAIGTDTDVVGARYYQCRFEETYQTAILTSMAHKDAFIQNMFPGQSTATGFETEVLSVTPSQLVGENITADDSVLKTADLIIIHDSAVAKNVNEALLRTSTTVSVFSSDNDISLDCFNALIYRQAGADPAMMILDQSALDANKNSDLSGTNLSHLYAVLNKYGAKQYYNVYCDGYDAYGNSLWTASSDAKAKVSSGSIYSTSVYEGSYFYGANEFVLNFDGSNAFFTSVLADTVMLSDKDNGTDLTESVNHALTNLAYEVNSLQFVSATTDATTGEVTIETLPMKTSVDVLEVQPVASFSSEDSATWRERYAPYFYWLIGSSVDLADDLTVTGQATYDFNSKIEDLNATYDLVYIGTEQNAANGANGYNDTTNLRAQNGQSLIYTTLGDLIDTNKGNVYFIGYTSGSKAWVRSSQGSDLYQTNTRYSSTDITEKKWDDLKEYSEKNPIVIADSAYTADAAVDATKLDSSSFVYNIARLGVTSISNMHIYKESLAAASIADSLAVDSCGITFFTNDGDTQGEDGHPVSYVDAEHSSTGLATVNNQTNEDDSNVLRYTFTLAGTLGTNYQALLYVDTNGNGAYTDDEEIGNLVITDLSTDETVTNGEMVAGHNYQVERALSDADLGMLPWKLVVASVDNTNVRDSQIGYTRVSGVKETIKVLQMNLAPDVNWNPSTNLNMATNAQFQALLAEIPDYAVSVEYMTNSTFTSTYKTAASWTEKLLSYDMLVLGFRDSATFTDNAIFLEGFKEFVDEGKSVILSHDMVADMLINYPLGSSKTWAVDQETSAYLRELSGQVKANRYIEDGTASLSDIVGSESTSVTYVGGEEVSTLPNSDLAVSCRAATALEPDNAQWRTGWSASVGLLSMNYSDYVYKLPKSRKTVSNQMDNSVRALFYATNSARDLAHDRLGVSSSLKWVNGAITTSVRVENDGQITTYPYNISDTIRVANTHVQNFKLNLDYDLGYSSGFAADGDYSEWEDVPKTSVSGYSSGQGGFTRTVIYNSDEEMLYSYSLISTHSNYLNPSNYLNGTITVTGEGGSSYWYNLINGVNYGTAYVSIFQVDSSGNIISSSSGGGSNNQSGSGEITNSDLVDETANVFYIGALYNGDNTYVTTLAGLQSSSTVASYIGKVIITPHASSETIELEFEMDMAALTTWNNAWQAKNNTSNQIFNDTIATIYYNTYALNGLNASTELTKDYVFPTGNNDDESLDAIVWYNLTAGVNNIYSSREGDSANNYYIYTKGNITYTGMGHSGNLTTDEMKLFVNTLVSAYRPVAGTPYLSVTNSDAVKNSSLYTLYAEERDGTPSDVTVNLSINDDSLIQQSGVQAYTVLVTDQDTGTLILEEAHTSVSDVVSFTVDADDLVANNDSKRYTAELVTSYESGETKTSSITIRVMTMAMFGLY